MTGRWPDEDAVQWGDGLLVLAYLASLCLAAFFIWCGMIFVVWTGLKWLGWL